MSCFEINNLTSIVNKNETNHFHIVLNGDYDVRINKNGEIDTSNLSEKEYGVLLHEYIHYTQHLLTLFGICRCKMFNLAFNKCIQYIHNKNKVALPIKLSEIDDGIQEYENSSKKIFGTQHYCNYNIDAVEVSDSMLANSRENKCAVKIGIYDFENNEAIDNEIEFGYWGIIESMAHLTQYLVDPDVNNRHDVIPYRIVELICDNKYPSIAKDTKMIITLCFCSLMFDNPGVAFFDLADYVCKQKLRKGTELYSYVINNISVNYKENCLLLKYAIPLFINELLNSIESIIGIKVNYLNKVTESCKNEVESGQSYLINMIYDDEIDFAKDSIKLLIKNYGLPLIQAKNVVVMPNSSKVKKQPYPETARLLGLEIFYKRIVSNSTKCPWYHICRKNQNLSEEERNSLNTDTTSYECLYDQWNKTQICLMTQTIKYYGLELKEFVQKT